MDTKKRIVGGVAGFVLYILFAYVVVENTPFKNFVFLLPFFLFLIGVAIGYFIKKFKESLLCGGIATVVGFIVILVLNFHLLLNFEHYIGLIALLIANAIGLFFGFGFGAILYYRVSKKREKRKIINKV